MYEYDDFRVFRVEVVAACLSGQERRDVHAIDLLLHEMLGLEREGDHTGGVEERRLLRVEIAEHQGLDEGDRGEKQDAIRTAKSNAGRDRIHPARGACGSLTSGSFPSAEPGARNTPPTGSASPTLLRICASTFSTA
jgi:hypothetical protein